MNKINIVLVLIGDAYVNISRLSYLDKDNKTLYDDRENFNNTPFTTSTGLN